MYHSIFIRLMMLCGIFLTHAAVAAPIWGVGTVTGRESGLSLSYREDLEQGFHFAGKIISKDAMSFEMDTLRYFRPRFLVRNGLELYTGLGLYGQAKKGETYEELYNLALPVGLEWHWPSLPLSLFMDQSLMVGPLPLTHIYGRFQFGLRALF